MATIHPVRPSPASARTGDAGAEIRASMTGGEPLPIGVRRFMEPRFGADFGDVRIHTTGKSAALNRQLSARAFTTRNHVFFGAGRFKPETDEGKELIAHELTHTIQHGAVAQRPESVHRSADVRVVERPSAEVHGSWAMDKVLNYFADKANAIPGFRMFTVILGVNPINMSAVDRSAANILRALIEVMPMGGIVAQALDNHGIFDKVGAWVEQQVASLGMVGSSFKQALMEFLKGFGVTDLANPGGLWERAKRIFTGPIDELKTFAGNLVSGIVTLIKDAILKPIAKLAEGTDGYALLKAVLGSDPITGEAVPQTAESLVEPFMKLIGQEEIWANMKKANAIGRAFAWFKGAMAGLMSFVNQIPGLFVTAFKSLQLLDIIVVPLAFAKLAKVFGGFLGEFVSWAGGTIWKLLEIIFDVVSPGALGYVKKTGAALNSILKNPLPFVGNLVQAAKLGFQNFAGNIKAHLQAGLIDWLTGSLPGVYIPKAFSIKEVVKFVFSVLGLSWANIRQKLVKVVGETPVKIMETGFGLVVTLVTKGPAAAWEEIQSQLSELKGMIISGITSFVIQTIVTKAVPKLIAMFIPGAGFISAILSIYDTVMVFVNKISKIIQVVTAFINSIVAIAAGNIGAAAGKVESILAGLLALAINFLAGFLGLGKVADKIRGVIAKVRGYVDKAIDWLINKIVTTAKKLFAKAFGKKDPKDKKDDLKEGSPEHKAAVDAGLKALAAATKAASKKDKIDKKAATGAAAKVRGGHKVFKAINVVDAGKSWDYEYVASPPNKFPGAHKGNGQLKISSVNVKDPNVKAQVDRAKAATEDRGAAWAAASKKFVDQEMVPDLATQTGTPIEPRDQYHKLPSLQGKARLNYEKPLTSAEPFGNRPDASAELLTPKGTAKAVLQVIVFEFTVVEDFYKTDAEGKPDKFAFHKMDQYFKTVQNLISKYGNTVPITYYFVAPREPTDDTKDYLAGVLGQLGATNIKVVWVAAS